MLYPGTRCFFSMWWAASKNHHPADKFYENQLCYPSDFVTKSNGESWDSSWEKLWVPVQNHCVPVKKQQWVPGSLCNHKVNLKTDSKTLYYSLLTNGNILLLLSSTAKVKEIWAVKQQPQEQPQKSHTHDTHQKLLQIDQSIFASFRMHTTNCFVSLRTLMHQGRR